MNTLRFFLINRVVQKKGLLGWTIAREVSRKMVLEVPGTLDGRSIVVEVEHTSGRSLGNGKERPGT